MFTEEQFERMADMNVQIDGVWPLCGMYSCVPDEVGEAMRDGDLDDILKAVGLYQRELDVMGGDWDGELAGDTLRELEVTGCLARISFPQIHGLEWRSQRNGAFVEPDEVVLTTRMWGISNWKWVHFQTVDEFIQQIRGFLDERIADAVTRGDAVMPKEEDRILK